MVGVKLLTEVLLGVLLAAATCGLMYLSLRLVFS